ncbi:MAG TPA: LssY C-terminal domain-containing protein, partial [Isosphaeraceae bacterium]|nr:LssY C-terminal domain-containing protein [Isosphaeraceae bacterium]
MLLRDILFKGMSMNETPEPANSEQGPTNFSGPHRSWWKRGPTTPMTRRRRWTIRFTKILTVIVILWFLAAYVVFPALWRHYEHHPALENAPKTTLTSQGIPGDALNVALLGTETQVVKAMLDAGWDPADPVTLRSSLRIA